MGTRSKTNQLIDDVIRPLLGDLKLRNVLPPETVDTLWIRCNKILATDEDGKITKAEERASANARGFFGP